MLITDTWHPQVNGVVTALHKLMQELEKLGYRVVVIHPGLFKTVPLVFYPEIRLALLPRLKMSTIFKKEKPDYIHIAGEWPLGIAARQYCLRHKLPFTTTYHTHLPLYVPHYTPIVGKRVGRMFYKYLSWFHNASERTFVASKSLKMDLSKHGFKHLEVVPLGVDVEAFKRNENAARRFEGPVFVYFGRVSEEKNIEEFFKMKVKGTKLVIGDGPSRKKMEEKYGNEAVFVGFKKGKELVDLLSIADVMVMPSMTETFGLVVVEALACGLPVAAHNVMGPKDVVTHGVDGFLHRDLGKAAKASLKLARKKTRQKALQFTWANSARTFLSNVLAAGAAKYSD